MLFSLVWLIYLAFPLRYLLERPALEMASGLAVMLFFAFIYLYSFRNNRNRFTLVLIQIAIVAYFTCRYDAGFIYLSLYPTAIIGFVPTMRKMAVAYAALIAFLGLAWWRYQSSMSGDDLLQMLPAMLIVISMPVAFRLGRRTMELREKLQLANEEIARLSKIEERQRISRDLHDTLGQTLSLITLKSELAEKLISKNPDRAVQEVRDIQQTSRAALKQVRELVSAMNTVTVEDEISNAKRILAAANISLEVKGGFAMTPVQPLVDNILGMCLREAVTNIVKHSRAHACVVERSEEGSLLTLSVSDDGKGMAAAEVEGLTGGNGLRGMRERLNLVEGVVKLESRAGEGTRISFSVPRVSKQEIVDAG